MCLSRQEGSFSNNPWTEKRGAGHIHIAYYAMQLDVWKTLDPSPEQLAEITRLDAKLAPIAKTSEEGRVLARNLHDRRHTLEGFMAKSDAELGLEFLLRMMKPG